MTASTLLTLSRAIIGCAWLGATIKIWKHRHLAHANHALAGSIAMVLSQAIILFVPQVPFEIAVFFAAMAQVTLAISFLRIMERFEALPTLMRGNKNIQMATVGIALASLNNLFLFMS
jgi:branched-subunit amino acid ABC-type transport system permease component